MVEMVELFLCLRTGFEGERSRVQSLNGLELRYQSGEATLYRYAKHRIPPAKLHKSFCKRQQPRPGLD